MGNIDWGTDKISVSLHDLPPVKNGESITLAPDITWAPVTGAKFEHVVVYGDERVRDWRWLWLRRKTVTRLLGSFAP